MVSWRLGARDAANAHAFIGRRVEPSGKSRADDHRWQPGLFGRGRDVYGRPSRLCPTGQAVRRRGRTGGSLFSRAKCLGADKRQIDGNPDMDYVSTSYAERQNLNIRMKNRRFTRLTNAFSKKAQNLAYSIALDFMHHNFVRKHQTLKTTLRAAMGLEYRTWTIRDIVELLPITCHSDRN